MFESNKDFTKVQTLQFRLELLTWTLDLDFGLKIWTWTLDLDFGLELWTQTLDSDFGLRLGLGREFGHGL